MTGAATPAAVLLDTHALLWRLDGDGRLSPAARAPIRRPPAVVILRQTSLVFFAGCARRSLKLR